MVHLLLLISPFSLPILSLSASRLSFVNRWLNGVQTTPASRKLQIISWSIVLIILIGSSQFFSSKSKFAGNVIGELGRGGWSDFFVQSEDYTGIRDDDKDIFDSSRMELITTDRTKLYNIVIILLESFHADAITPYNLSLQTTPFLNKLSKNSMLVNKMYALNNYTTDGIITVHCGNYPPDRKSTQYPIFYKGLPDLLEPLGYGSSYFTGQKLNYEHNRKLVKNIGFKDIHGQNDLPKEGYSKINWTGYEERITLKPSLKWIDQSIEKDQPFIITYLTTTSHQPYTVPEAFSKIQYTHPSNKLLNDYYNAIRYVDAFLENLFSEFEKRGLFDSSIFILVGDHGDNVGKGLRKLTEPSFHVPCLILGPSIKGVNHIGGMRQQIDILPTIIDYLGLDITNGKIPGTSLLEDVSKDRYIFFRNWNPNDPLLVRTGDLKYIFPKDGSAARVHNIEEDPDEQRNISNQFTPEHLGAIKEKYLHWHIRVNYNYDRHLKGYQP